MTETKTMLPVIEFFMAAYQLPDAGMISEANQKAIDAAGLSFILGTRIPYVPYVVTQWRRVHLEPASTLTGCPSRKAQ